MGIHGTDGTSPTGPAPAWPGTLTHDDAWEDVWPKSHQVWRAALQVDVIGHTREQAEARLEYFQETLESLWLAGYDVHPLVRFVHLARMDDSIESPTLRHIGTETTATFPESMMGDTGFYWSWWDPSYEEDIDAFSLGEQLDSQFAMGSGAATKLRRIEHALRAAAAFGRSVDPNDLLRIIDESSDDPD